MIYTFYSYKGGVGRSMALANIAERFHETGLRVIIVDWDLEAPGLETFFVAATSDKPAADKQLADMRTRPGLIDMLMTYRKEFPRFASRHTVPPAVLAEMAASESTPSQPSLEEQRKRASELTRKVLKDADFPEFLLDRDDRKSRPVPSTLPAFLREEVYRPARSFSELPSKLAASPFAQYLQRIHAPDTDRENGVYLMAAGARPDNDFSRYAITVQEFDWSGFYAAYGGREYFTWFRDQLKALADVILIDSRTGVTEMGGVCTRHIADVVVSFCAPNFQNVDGVVRVIAGLNKEEVRQARNERAVEVMVIPTRIDDTESDRLKEFSENFDQKVERGGFVPMPMQDLVRPLWNLQIPYIPRYNYREERVIGPGTGSPDPATQKLINAYRRIAAHLAVLAPEDARIRNVFAGEIRSLFPHLSKEAPQLAPPVSDRWVERPQEVQKLKDELVQRAGSPQISRLAVYGLAGSGKTSLVARVCRDSEVVAAYPDGILWVSADRHWTTATAVDWLRTTLGLSQHSGERGLRQSLASRRFLVVADDVWNYGDVEDLFKFFEQGTQVMITRDLAVANQSEAVVMTVGALTTDEARKILKLDALPLVDPNEPRQELAQQILALPLGATLLRSAVEGHLAQGEKLADALANLRDAFERHGVVAFDQLKSADRNTSIAQSLKESISHLTPDEGALLVRIAKADELDVGSLDGGTRRAAAGSSVLARLQRLVNVGLVEVQGTRARSHPLIRAYLMIDGRLDERVDSRPRKARVSSSADKVGSNPDVEIAKRIIRGASADFDEIRALAARLEGERYFTYARQLYARARAHPEARRQPDAQLRLAQKQAVCTYRDPDLPADNRFNDALALLEDADLGAPQPSSETLGLAGAIHKYRWRLTGYRRDLERSATCYGAGAARGVMHDEGYTAINAAFVLDLLAQQECQNAAAPDARPGAPAQGREDLPEAARRHGEKARSLREQITAELAPIAAQKSKSNWWILATLAEACFGLSRHEEARYWLREGLAFDPSDWQLETTARQFIGLAIAQNMDLADGSDAHRVLRVILSDAVGAIRSATIGKVGLALSGGGFRASLFHIGVLARMAELDMLRHVEVLSCVSGGSIVGAHYYLEVRRLLHEKPDGQISREDYIEIVRRIEREFLTAIQKNLRTRLFAAWWANFRTILQPAYTRTVHLGELFERHIYSRVSDGHHGGRRWLNELLITPNGDRPDFNPKIDNWRRSAKAPILLLNATTLNTGHNWQFAVSWMGEPPLGASSPVDRNEILRRLYYWEAPPPHTRIALGQAVAASACVPSLFEPIELKGLYPDRSVRLVDGGVHDNQGIVGLLEQECSVMLISDASGQTSSVNHPSEGPTSVAVRANNLLMARVREVEYRGLDLLSRSSALNGLAYLHLKQELQASQVDWIDCQDPHELLDGTSRHAPLTSYGMPRPVQSRLAAIRTDLDSFSDVEGYTLMLSGYRMATTNFRNCLPQWPFKDAERVDWDFLSIAEIVSRELGTELEHARLTKLLTASANRSLKAWRLAPGRMLGLSLAAGAPFLGLAWLLYVFDQWPQIGLWARYEAIGAASFGAAAWLAHLVCRTRKSVTVIATGIVAVTLGWAVALAHLAIFDQAYLQLGKVPRRSRRKNTDKARTGPAPA